MDASSSSIRQLARRLLTESQAADGMSIGGPALVSERLRVTVTEFAGVYGFATLLRRALALAAADVPELGLVNVTVADDGQLRGLERLAAHADAVRHEAALAITAHLLALLVTFVGVAITQRLVRKTWPQLPPNDEHLE
jgi:hypothetical protein